MVSQKIGNLKEEYDVVIVGAGIGGLTCGAFLAKAGLKTLIVEKHSIPGGYVTSFKRKDFTFDGGAEGILGCGEDGYLKQWLKELGLDKGIQFTRIDPLEYFVSSQARFPIHADLGEFKKELAKLFPSEKEGIDKYFETVIAMAKEIKSGADKPPKNPFEMIKFAMRYPVVTKYYGRKKMSFQDLLDEFLKNFKLKGLLGIYSGWFGMPPSKVISPIAAFVMTDVHIGGNYYPKGGLLAFSNHLAEGFKKAGGILLLKTVVSKILVEDGRAVGVELENKTKIKARYVVSNADAKQTFLKLVGEENLDKKFVEYIKELKQSISGILVFLGIDMDLRKYPSHISYGEDPESVKRLDRIRLESYDGEITEIISGLAIRIPSNLEPSYAPPGKSSVILLAQAPYDYRNNWKTGPNGQRTDAYRALKNEVADKLIAMAENVIPNLSKHIIVRDMATPLTFERYTWQYKGGWYGTPLDQQLPSNITPIKGLLLAGSNTFGAGVNRAFQSGMETAKQIIAMEKM